MFPEFNPIESFFLDVFESRFRICLPGIPAVFAFGLAHSPLGVRVRPKAQALVRGVLCPSFSLAELTRLHIRPSFQKIHGPTVA